MIIDSSAIIAVFLREPGFDAPLEKLIQAEAVGVGTPTLAETGIVLSFRLGSDSGALLDRFIREFGIRSIPFGPEHWREAVEANVRFGKGRHPAGLSFGDCMTYAVARLSNQPLLCIGEDFSKTDLEMV